MSEPGRRNGGTQTHGGAEMAVGGYFELELPQVRAGGPLQGANLYQSARAAFLSLLRSVRPTAVWMPWLLCDSMAEPLAQAGVEARRYRLDVDFRPQLPRPMETGELLLYVNYFGLYGQVEVELVSSMGVQLILDHAQALYARPGGALATLASPRKFVGVPDGGALWTSVTLAVPTERDEGSLERAQGMLRRLAFDAEAGYEAFGQAERELSFQEPMQLSFFTQRLLKGIDFPAVAEQRCQNFDFLDQALAEFNQLEVPPRAGQVPLCYPFWPKSDVARSELHARRIYVPRYWPELLDKPELPEFERRLATQLLPLPVDQRYDPAALHKHLLLPLLRLLGA